MTELSTDPPPAGETGAVRHAALAEATVVARAQDGDLDSFEVLLRRYQGPIFRLGRRMLSDVGEAEDVVQDTFLLVWRRLPTLADPTLFRSWIYQIATRRCLTTLRSRRRRPVDLSDPLDTDTLATVPIEDGPAAAAERAAIRAGLDEALDDLPAEQRACWVLRELHDLSYDEIARATGLPLTTVRGRIARARQNLAKGMSAWR